jgi:O-antigen chain-terminating methyltransferase
MKANPVTRVQTYFKALRQDVQRLYTLLEELNHKTVENEKEIKNINIRAQDVHDELNRNIAMLNTEVEHARTRSVEVEHILTAQKHNSKVQTALSQTNPNANEPSSKELFADNHDLDAFYLEFENHFRGDENEIKLKQQPYIDIYKQAKAIKKLPIVDLGCGRGEFLDLLKENGLNPIGVDLNESMVKRARQKGYDAVLDDAIGYLLKQKTGSLGGVTGFHLAEHIPFDQLLILIAESYRCLAKDGILLLETPNPESLFVGAFTFHYDPSHLKPLPPAIVQFAAEFKGFAKAEILRRQPELTHEQIVAATKNETLQGALQRLYGPRDYALVAYK